MLNDFHQVPLPFPLALAERKAFVQRPIAERQRVLAEQAAAMQNHYEQNTDWQHLMVGGIIEC